MNMECENVINEIISLYEKIRIDYENLTPISSTNINALKTQDKYSNLQIRIAYLMTLLQNARFGNQNIIYNNCLVMKRLIDSQLKKAEEAFNNQLNP